MLSKSFDMHAKLLIAFLKIKKSKNNPSLIKTFISRLHLN